MEKERGEQREYEQGGGRPARDPADDHQQAADYFDQEGAPCEQLRQRQALACDIANRAFKTGDLADAGHEEDLRDQQPAEQRSDTKQRKQASGSLSRWCIAQEERAESSTLWMRGRRAQRPMQIRAAG